MESHREAVARAEQDLPLLWEEAVGVDVAAGGDGDLEHDARVRREALCSTQVGGHGGERTPLSGAT